MTYLICGVGQAGGSIVNEMFADRKLQRVATPLAINSTLKDLQGLRNIPRSNWLGLSEVQGIIPGNTAGFEEMVVGGFGKDPQRAQDLLGKNQSALAEFFRTFAAQHTPEGKLAEKQWEVVREGEEWTGVESELGSVPFALLVLGLGGGTGCGATPLIAKAIREASAASTSILVVGILPATHENGSDGAHGTFRQAWNALYALNELRDHVDGFLLIDNESLAFTRNIELMFPSFNRYVAHALNDLLLGHLLEGVDPGQFEHLSLPVIDLQDLVSAVSFGTGKKGRRPGYATLGWAAQPTRELFDYFLPGLRKPKIDMASLFQRALSKQSIQGARPEEAQKNLGLVRLPVSLAARKDLAPQTSLVEAELGRLTSLNETHFGITLGKRPLVSVNAVFTYEFHQLVRIRQIQEFARRYSTKGVKGL